MDIIVLDMSVSVDRPFHRLAFSDPMECKLFIHANRSLNTFLASINLILAVKIFAYLRPEVRCRKMLILPQTHFSPACGKPLMVSSKDIDQYVFSP